MGLGMPPSNQENRFVSIERQLSNQSEKFDRLVTAIHEVSLMLAENVQVMRNTQQQVENAHSRIDRLTENTEKRFDETSRSILNLTVAQEKLTGLIQQNVMTKEKFLGWLVIGIASIGAMVVAIDKFVG